MHVAELTDLELLCECYCTLLAAVCDGGGHHHSADRRPHQAGAGGAGGRGGVRTQQAAATGGSRMGPAAPLARFRSSQLEWVRSQAMSKLQLVTHKCGSHNPLVSSRHWCGAALPFSTALTLIQLPTTMSS